MKVKSKDAWRDWSHNPRVSRKYYSGMRLKDKKGFLRVQIRMIPVIVRSVHLMGQWMIGTARVNGADIKVKAPFEARAQCKWEMAQ